MKVKIIFLFTLLCFILVSSCTTTNKTPKNRYRITIDSSISDPFVRSAWMSYTGQIRADMEKFYIKNPEGEYIIPFKIELNARNSMIDFYLRVQKDYKISDSYIEDLIKIRSSNKVSEYVFFSFNPGSWVNENNYNEKNYTDWMKSNMPEHTPKTLARIEKID